MNPDAHAASPDSEQQARLHLDMQYSVAEILSKAATDQEACSAVLGEICSILHFQWGAFWFRTNGHLQLLEQGRALPQLEPFASISRTLLFAPGEGLPGMVWKEQSPIWIPDFAAEGLPPRRAAACECGLHAAFGFPVRGQEFIGVMEFFSDQILPPDSKLLHTLRAIGAQIGQFIERKRAELALAESQSLFLAIFNGAQDAILLSNDLGELIETNPAATKLLGFSRASLLGKKVWEILGPAGENEGNQSWREFLRDGGQNREVPLRRHDGSAIEVDHRAVARIVPGVHLSILRDITERKHREWRTKLLAEAGVALGEGLDYSATASRVARMVVPDFADLCLLDVVSETGALERVEAAHADPRLEWVLKRLKPNDSLLPVSSGAEEVLGAGTTRFLPRIPEVLRQEAGRDDETSNLLRELAPSSAILAPLKARGRTLGVITFVRRSSRDSFAREDVELAEELARRASWAIDNARLYEAAREELRLRERVERALKKLNQDLETRIEERTAALRESHSQMEAFCYSVSHDLRAPLRSMHGFSQALLDEHAERLGEEGRDFARRIVAAAEHMDGLLADVLTYSRLTRQELKLELVNVDSVLDDVRLQLLAEIKKRGGTVEANAPCKVWAHRGVLELALMNLVENGLKFVPEGRMPRVTVTAEPRGERWRIWVRDNGIGIAPEHHHRVFRMFERLHGVETYPGTGIGLALVRKAAERMNGACGVESTLGQGSAFWMELPAEMRYSREQQGIKP